MQTIHVGQNIKKIRKAKGLSQAQLAAAVGLPRERISVMERHENMTSKTIVRMAHGLKVKPYQILSGDLS